MIDVQLKNMEDEVLFPQTDTLMIEGLDAALQSKAALKQYLINLCYPIGSILFMTTATNPSAALGGTWTQLQDGVVIVGVGSYEDDNGETRSYEANTFYNGNNELVMTEEQTPSHTHYNGWTSIGITGSSTATYDDGRKSGTTTSAYYSSTVGGSEPQNTQQPYIVVKIWQRTAL